MATMDKAMERAMKAGRYAQRTCNYCRMSDWGVYTYREEGAVVRRTCQKCGHIHEFDAEIIGRCTHFDGISIA